ncbi:rhamnogalacturonan acetylesterase [Streptomyces apocyni]|uniref:rhamnogalacturonan acetylesterase n=1 Tax=Streptomyces apocyni TaxID=2654677 RepID=UPI0012E9D107|nr:rhamnogalacturonan acetylesterase [Streptomyces apocyni]
MRRRTPAAALLAALTILGTLATVPAQATPLAQPPGHGKGRPLENCTRTTPIRCHFDVEPGTYDVTVQLGGRRAGSTAITAETHRTLLAETATRAGERLRRTFTIDVRTPEGEPTGPDGTPGLDLVFSGDAPRLTGLKVAPARQARQLLLIGDSTSCDQPEAPYSGWGQQLPQYLERGLSVANQADSGESTVSYLANPALFATVRGKIREDDLVLIQLAHNDKQTDAATYRANLTALVEGVRAEGGRPVIATPIVRRWFTADGTLDNDIALIVNGLGVNLPAEARAMAASLGTPLVDMTALTKARVEQLGPDASKALYLTDEKRDNTHTSLRGATEYAALAIGELRAQGLVD